MDEYYKNILECQDCGDRIRKLTNSEIQDCSYNPYKYIVFCNECRRDRKALDTPYGF